MKGLYIIAASLFCTTLYGCGLDCIDKKTGMHKSSRTINDSKEKGVFKFEMFINKKEFDIGNKNVFKIKNAWVENGWLYDCINNEAVLIKDSFFRFVIDGKYIDKTDSLDFVFMEKGNRRGAFLGSRLSFAYSNEDTFQLTLQDYHTKTIFDTLKFHK